jgi:PAS domain S-box-containing protein
MPLYFWLAVAAYLVSMMIAIALALMVFGFAPGRSINRFFVLFISLVAASAGFNIIHRLFLWLNIGNPHFMLELQILAVLAAGPLLLMFTVRYLDHRTPFADTSALIGLVVIIAISIPLFQHRLIYNPYLDEYGISRAVIGIGGRAISALPLAFFLSSAVLFWRGRKRIAEPYLPLGVLILLIGMMLGWLFNLPPSFLAISQTASVLIIGYAVIGRQLFNPLRERNAELEREIIERKRIEEERLRSQYKFHDIVENMEIEGYNEHDLAGNTIYASKESLRKMGYSREEYIGMNYKRIMSPETAKKIFKIYNWIYRTGISVSLEEYEVIRKDGSVMPIEASAGLLRDASGKPIGFWTISRDITERKKAEKKLRETLTALREKEMELYRMLVSRLASKETEIFGYVGEGLSQREIARKLGVQDSTVYAHISHIKEKLDISDTNKLYLFASEFKKNYSNQ